MVKFIAAMRRKPGMSSQEFHRYWREGHAPLVQSLPGFFGYVRRYVQSHAVEVPGDKFAGFDVSGFDGFAELWFDSLADAEKAFTSPGYLGTIRADERKFVDGKGSRVVMVEEVPMYPR
jgi:uncharacterized protein (TIGR02118 family)